jgi:mono/diheme cytochrome c family protein
MEAGRKNDYKEGDLGGKMRKFILGGVAFLALFALVAIIYEIQNGNINSRYDGQVVYQKNCQFCHGDNGQGALSFPALNSGDWYNRPNFSVPCVVKHGKVSTQDSTLVMLGYPNLSATDVANLMNFMNEKWYPNEALVTPLDIEKAWRNCK